MTHLQIIADDYGLSRAINRGIEDLARAGRLDGVSIMAHRDADLSSVDALLEMPVELGIHLVFVGEDLLLPLEWPSGGTRSPANYKSLFVAIARRPALAEALVREAEAQIEKLKACGVRLAFLNSHQHVHMFPPLWRALRPLMERERLRVRVSRSLTVAPLKQLLVDLAGVISWKLWPLSGCDTARPLGIEVAGHFDERAAVRIGARLARIMPAVTCELVVHPGHEDAALQARYAHWGYRWAQEYRVLASGSARAAFDGVTTA